MLKTYVITFLVLFVAGFLLEILFPEILLFEVKNIILKQQILLNGFNSYKHGSILIMSEFPILFAVVGVLIVKIISIFVNLFKQKNSKNFN